MKKTDSIIERVNLVPNQFLHPMSRVGLNSQSKKVVNLFAWSSYTVWGAMEVIQVHAES